VCVCVSEWVEGSQAIEMERVCVWWWWWGGTASMLHHGCFSVPHSFSGRHLFSVPHLCAPVWRANLHS